MRLTKLSIFSFFGLLLLLWGCGTSNQAVLPKQFFHDLTSRYNAHFNVNEKLKGVIKLSEQNHKDKFDSVIPVYYYSDPKEFASYSSDLDDIIKRSTLAIQIHAPSNWTDDHFILMGVANYLKGDYLKADNNFKYITTNFKDGVDYVKVMRSLGKKVGKYQRAKKKPVKPQVKMIVNKDGSTSLQKVDNRPEKSIWIHTPARSEALIWLIKTYTRQNKFEDADAVLTYTKGDNNFYKNYDHELLLAEADLRVSQKRYKDAIVPLEKYLVSKKVMHRKRLRVRPLFVLAQCYTATGDYTHATQKFSEVLKSHPNYDMEFYAKIKMAKLGRGKADNNDDMRSLLVKMSRDAKYKDYWDQVFYELALLSLDKNNKVEARAFLRKSIENSTTNDDQKSLSYLKMAELDYADEAYETAKLYYDSTLTVMQKSDPRYPDIEERDKMLDNLVKQLAIIAQEDSLQQLAVMPKELQEKAVRAAIARKEREEEEKKAAADAAKQQQQLNNFNNNLPSNSTQTLNTQSGGGWYFYNTSARATGYNEFVKKWGKRKLEENWRRKNKASLITEEEPATGADSTGAKKDSTQQNASTSNSPEDQLMAGIPNTPEKMEQSVTKIVDAYYTAGTIYKDGLDAYSKAQDIFETMNSKYPKHKLLLESYYNLYLVALKMKQNDRAEKYKALILEQFPESIIAKVLRDPNYMNEARKKEQVADRYYEDAYNDYASGKLDSAWYKCEMANVVLKNNPLEAKFQLLEALVLARQNKLAEYIQALNKIINKSNDAQVKKTASDLLAALNRSTLPQVDLSKDTAKANEMNSQFPTNLNPGKPDSSDINQLQKMEQARLQAAKNGDPKAKQDTTTKAALPAVTTPTTTAKDTATKATPASTTKPDTTATKTSNAPVTPSAPAEDTTSPYVRGDETNHYFVVYFKEGIQQSVIMGIMANINAYNSTQFSDKRLSTKQVIIDANNKLLRVNQFKNKDDALQYYKAMRSQSQLYTGVKPDEFTLIAISAANMGTLMSLKDVAEYNKFFNRVYK